MLRTTSTETFRRSSRVRVNIPILVTSLQPGSQFSETCETLIVSAHGCALRSPVKFDAGVPMHFSINGRHTMAHVVDCQSSDQGWMLAAKLDHPENFWGLKPCPEDWVRFPDIPVADKQGSRDKGVPPKMPMLRSVVAELIEPLQAEIAELKEKLAHGGAVRGGFEISLSHIPPEVEEKLWTRLRQDLGAQVLSETRQHSQQMLAETKATIEEKLAEAQDDFRGKAVQQLQTLDQRAQGLSHDVADAVRQHLQAGTAGFHQEVADAHTNFQRQAEEFLKTLQQRLVDEHSAHQRHMQRMHEASSLESSRLQTHIADLGGRVASLDEAARRLETDLDARLQHMAGETLAGARARLQSDAGEVLSGHISHLNAEINSKVLPLLNQSQSLVGDVREATDSMRAENDRANLQIVAVRDEEERFRHWLDEQASAYKAQLRDQLQQEIYHAASGARAQLEVELKTALSAHLDETKSHLTAELERLMDRASSLEKTLIQETGAWLAQQSMDFQKTVKNTLSDSDRQVKDRVEAAIEAMAARGAKDLGAQLDEGCARLRQVQHGIEASVSEALSTKVADTLQSYERTMEQLAHQSVERWRQALARDLSSIAQRLGEQFQVSDAGTRS
jgi:hypothetical protein